MPPSPRHADPRYLPPFPTRRSSDLYDGTNLRLWANGVNVQTTAVGGLIPTSSGALTIGGNSVWPEWFQGLIDNVRLYNRALSANEIDRKSTRLNSSHQITSYAAFSSPRRPPLSPPLPYTTLFRSLRRHQPPPLGQRCQRPDHRRRRPDPDQQRGAHDRRQQRLAGMVPGPDRQRAPLQPRTQRQRDRSEEHTSELQSPDHLVCRLLLATPTPAISPPSLHDALPISTTAPTSASGPTVSTSRPPPSAA